LRKHYPAFLSLLGILGLATAMVFLVGVVLSFIPGNSAIASFFVGKSDLERSFAFLMVGIPYALLIAHLYLRTHAGLWFLKRDEVELAEEYCRNRLKVTLGRGRKEVAFHRLYLAQALIRRSKYKEALDLLAETKGLPKSVRTLYYRWRLEAALRHEDLVLAKSVYSEAANLKDADLIAASAELAIRERKPELAKERLTEASWLEPNSARVKATEILLKCAPEMVEEFQAAQAWIHAVPGAELELRLAAGLDVSDQSCLERADSRSKYVLKEKEKNHEVPG